MALKHGEAKINNKTLNNTVSISNFKQMYNRYGIFFILIALVVLMSVLSPSFLTVINLMNVVRQISFIAMVGIGVTMVIITTGIDLSSGSVIALASVVSASFAHPNTYPLVVPVLLGLAMGVLCGAVNGSIIAKAKIPPFIVTLGMMTVARGAALLYSNGKPIGNFTNEFIFLGAGKIMGIPVPIIILLFVATITHIMLNNTKFGRHVYAIGGNEQAAIISGVNVNKVKVLVYTYASFLAALAGIVLTARISSGQPGLGVSYELDAIAAAVIGGTSLSTGGIGTVAGTITGALIIGVINNGMDLLNVSAYWQQIVKGVIIVAAVLLDQMKNK
ncbi:ABC transporter permease [Petroclostridium xylanilyticum]|uniref:ABC transporter permease n=1 Tax=Petroclostridium xylanilyticum TaxID=1792311 RepID=UPI000B9893E3|nr:ABC transporter permease [Petroclostridium xylanilyticum]